MTTFSCMFLLLSIPAFSEAGTCDVEEGERKECGFIGINQTQCEGGDCCWKPSNAQGAPWCFRKSSPSPAPSLARTAFVHLFEWSWPSVAAECENVLGPHGYDGVQVSPPMEHIQGDAWWTRYQPVSYKLVSRSGDEAAFKDMVKRCNAVGIQVIVDAVVNHMASGSGTGTAGSSFGNRWFPAAGYSQDDFHHSSGDKNSNCPVNNYHDKHNVQYCDLVGLPDLCTGCSHTRSQIVDYLTKLSSMGSNVGFRFDAAKHQDAEELHAIISQAGNPWNFGEVISGGGEAVTPSMYTSFELVTEFEFSRKLAPNFKDSGKLQYLENFGETWGLLPSDQAVTFLDNHDTQRGEAILTYKNGAIYNLANVFMLATPYGYPKVMSSYDFSSHDQGPPSYPVKCGSGWVCEHSRPEIANMVAWRKVAGRSPISNFQNGGGTQSGGGNRIAFSRGGVAFLAMNRDDHYSWSADLQTGLPAGTYCNVIQSGDVSSCPKVVVAEGGKASITVGPITAVALHIGKTAAAASVSIVV